MPRVGSKQSIVRTPPATQRAMVTFCWLPPERRRTSPWARVSICSRSIGAVDRHPLRAQVDQAPAPERGGERQRDVLADRALHQQRLGAVGRDVDEARADRVRGMAERRPVAVDRAARRRPGGSSRRGCRTARPGPGPRARRRPAPRPGTARTRRPRACVPEPQARWRAIRGGRLGGRAAPPSPGGSARRRPGRCRRASARRSAPRSPR